MSEFRNLQISWMRVGGVCGLLGVAAYACAAFVPMPDALGYATAFGFGPLLAIGSMGLYYSLSSRSGSPRLQIAAAFAIGGGFTVLVMLCTQQAIFSMRGEMIRSATSVAEADVARTIGRALNSVHLGIDVAWDVLMSVAMILFASAMFRHPSFGRIMGALGVTLGSLLLVFNIWYFPTPPGETNSIDWGPFAALWFVAVFILMLRAAATARQSNLATAAATLTELEAGASL